MKNHREMYQILKTWEFLLFSLQNGQKFRSYVAESPNNTWTQINDDIYLDKINETLIGGVLDVSIPFCGFTLNLLSPNYNF